MSYRIKPHKSASKQVRRIARDRLEKARKALLLPAEQRAHGIHQARKRLKEVRALARLVRTPLGRNFAHENRRFRDINRKLSAMRDAGALIETWDALARIDPELFAGKEKLTVRKRLVIRGQDGGQTIEESYWILREVMEDLTEAENALASWSLSGKGFALVANGLGRSLNDGRKALEAACDCASDERLHDWRKRVKDHWYHTRLLQASWPAAFKARADMLKELSELLGQDQDLAMLQMLLGREPALFGTETHREQLLGIAGQKRASLQESAFSLGQRFFAEPSAALVKRWERYWTITQTELR